MKFVTKQMHAYLDYPVAISLMVVPFVLGLGSSNILALYLSMAVGVAAFLLTLLTDHHLGVIRVIPYNIHLLVDGLVGVIFLATPFVFSFQGLDALYYWINGIAVLTVVGLHKPAEAARVL